MTRLDLNKLRNIGIISHIDAGKTTVSERVLFYTGESHRLGEVHDGNAIMDWMEQEQERGITITATTTCCHWRDVRINLIDTPGHIDFTIEVERSLRVLDGALVIFSAVEGVQAQTESVWRQADRYAVPRICLINKMDRIGSDFRRVLEQMQRRFTARPVLMQLPLGIEGTFAGVVDILEGRLLTFAEDDLGATVQISEVPEALRSEVAAAREQIVEAAADFDDTILTDFLESTPVTTERIKAALRRGVLECRLFPVFLGSALRNKGIQPILDAVIDFLPSPLETPPIKAIPLNHGDNPQLLLTCDPKGPLCALAFKVLSDEGRRLTYLRVYSGTVHAGDELFNSTRGVPEKPARLFRMHAHKRERVDEVQAGDIVAAVGLKHALTGDTLCHSGQPLRLEGLRVPEPVVSLAVEPRHIEDRDKLPAALEKLLWEDPTFRMREDPDTGQTILTGMGQLHLEIITERLHREFGVEVRTGRPQVVYRETVQGKARHQEKFHRETEGRVQSGDVTLEIAPLDRGQGLRVTLPEGEGQLLPPLREELEKCLRQACAAGMRTGYPLTDAEITVLEAPFEPGVTTEIGLRAAAQRGLSMVAAQAGVTLLEPVMALELTVPVESAGQVIGSLQQKRGRIDGLESRIETELIQAYVPLSELFDYMGELRSATKGRGTFVMEFSHYDQAPSEVQTLYGLT
ncbi:MAG: elongation factor G [Pedobacter sp.]